MRILQILIFVFAWTSMVGQIAAFMPGEYNSYPLGLNALTQDSNSVLYAQLQVSSRFDSCFYRGKLKFVKHSRFLQDGSMCSFAMIHADVQDTTWTAEWTYNSSGRIDTFKKSILFHEDTIDCTVLRLIKYDSAFGVRKYEISRYINGATPKIQTYSQGGLLWDYTNSMCTTRWNSNYVPRTIFDFYTDETGNEFMTAVGFNGDDTLFVVSASDTMNSDSVWVVTRINLENSISTESVTCYERGIGRLYSSMTTQEGKIIEHHRYVHAAPDEPQWGWSIFNLLKDSVGPEILVTISDTLIEVKKNGFSVFIDEEPNDPDEAPPIAGIPPPPLNMTSAKLDDTYPYITRIRLPNGGLEIKCYNFTLGTTKPIIGIWIDKDGLVYHIEGGGWVIRRSVTYN